MIKKADVNDLECITKMALLLWPNHESVDMHNELKALLSKSDASIFIAFEQSMPIGFAQCQLRHDYVEGTETSPVGYLEGIYVVESYRKKGIARKLLLCCERWAKEQGCAEFASDCEINNLESLNFHLHVGFEEANRIICFSKKLF